MMARVVSFELSSQNPEVAVQFYEKVFGWKAGTPNWGYWPVTTGDDGSPGNGSGMDDVQSPTSGIASRHGVASGIDGGISRGPADFPHGTRIIVEVDDIDQTLRDAKANHAQVLREKMEFDSFYLAYLVDPTGIAFGVIQSKS